jgi:pimeloyl-ACP methyl ester carboxylesterase
VNFWKRKPVLGIGIGVGVMGAVALAVRYGMRRTPREPIPDDISPAIFATRVASTSHGEMVYHISGSGEPLVFLHGIYLGASSYEWSKVYPHFTMGHEVIVPDLVGFGESERPGVPMDATDYAESLAEFLLETCPGRQPVIVASGLTAGIALLLASRHPERISRLVVLLPTGLKESGKWRAAGMVALVGLPGLNRFVYQNYLSRPPFIRGWLSRFALGDPSRVNEEMVRVLSTCARQAGAKVEPGAASRDDPLAGQGDGISHRDWIGDCKKDRERADGAGAGLRHSGSLGGSRAHHGTPDFRD